MTHVCGHVVYVFRTCLIFMSHGFHACDPVRAHDLFYEYWLAARYGGADSDVSADGFHSMTHHESWVAWREGMSHAGLVLREEPLYKGTLGAWDMGHELSPLYTRQLKSQHHENWSSTSTPALSVCCTCTLSELHPHSPWAAPPPSPLTSLIMSLGPGVLVFRGCLAVSPPLSPRASLPGLALARLATPSRPC